MQTWAKQLAVPLVFMSVCSLAQTGKLSAEDATFEGGYYYDPYPYEATAGERLIISIRSEDFDPYLIVFGPDDQIVWEKDDSEGQGLNVLETVILKTAGQHTIVVSSAAANETGRYELDIQGSQEGQPNSQVQTAQPSTTPSQAAEANVVKGRITDLQGDPVVGATVTISGYSGNGANVVEQPVTDASGFYYQAVPAGLYNVDAEAEISYDGQTYHLYLHPADGSCEEMYSEAGIVKDFVLKLSGFMACPPGLDATNYNNYSGGTLFLNYAYPQNLPAGSQLTFTLTPVGPLLDGSGGDALTFVRDVSAMATGYGQLDDTYYLHDIPVGTYRIEGLATLPDGTTRVLSFGPYLDDQSAPDYEFGFEAVRMFPYGIRVTSVSVYDDASKP